MPTELRQVQRLEIALWFRADRQRWISYCPATNNTTWGETKHIAIERMRNELDAEEKDYETFGLPTGSEPVPVGAEILTLQRRGKRWS